jgi:plastocyanin
MNINTKLVTTLFLACIVVPSSLAMAKEHTVKEVSAPGTKKPYYFEPATMTIQPGDTVTFVNVQNEMHNVMFDSVPKTLVDDMIMGPDQEKVGARWSYTFTVPGTYHCHPHEALGMRGTLIVGHASAPGDTKNIEHGD